MTPPAETSAYRSELMRGPRGFLEIAYSVLSACRSGALKTHVMFKCNLNSKQLYFYLESLVAKGLLEKRRDPPSAKVTFWTTADGRMYLEAYESLLLMVAGGRS